MRKDNGNKPRFLALRPGGVLYLILLPIALIFTQALRSPASAILFIFLMIIPLLSILYIVIARAGIKVYTDVDKTRAEKGDTVEYEIKIINDTFLPFPFVETVVSMPSETAVVCEDVLMRITLLPGGCHLINEKVSFPLRGSYDIGVKTLRIGDPLGLFRTDEVLYLHRTVIVYPRNIGMSADVSRSETDLTTSLARRTSTPDVAEPADIRQYVPGDQIKNIHWKLSSKAEDLLVKQFSSDTDRQVYILCDLSFAGDAESAPKAEAKAKAPKKKLSRKEKKRLKKKEKQAREAKKKAERLKSAEVAAELTDPEARLRFLGITSEEVASLSVKDPLAFATKSGEKKSGQIVIDNMARLAVKAEKRQTKEEAAKVQSPFDASLLPFAGELACDGVIELALSQMRYESAHGAYCTLLYADPRKEGGIGVLSSENDLPDDPALLEFCTVPVSKIGNDFAHLSMAIEGSSNLTIRMVSANSDLESSAVFAAVPTAFGGAGSGCAVEVLLTEPAGLWQDKAARASEVRAMEDELSRTGISVNSFTVEVGQDGVERFCGMN